MARLHQFSPQKACYYCGEAPRSKSKKEHAPPAMMFAGFKCTSITVPSCDEHNLGKGERDQAVVAAMIGGVYKMLERHPESITPNIQKALQNWEQYLQQAKKNVTLRPFVQNPPPGFGVYLPFVQLTCLVF